MIGNTDFLLETHLKALDPRLHRRFTDCAAIMPTVLDRYVNNFPHFTDHSMRHAINVIEFCNKLIGTENIEKMNAAECFVLLMGIYLHDMGMGISEREFLRMYQENHIDAQDTEQIRSTIRKLHHEISGNLIRRYASLFELEDETVTHAVVQTVRGHRVTDIRDGKEYPVAYELKNGQTVCLPYLAALIRLSDEIDMGSNRNDGDLYDASVAFAENEIAEFARHRAIRNVRVEPTALVIEIHGDDDIYQRILQGRDKLEGMLVDCRAAVNGRTKFTISQEKVLFERV